MYFLARKTYFFDVLYFSDHCTRNCTNKPNNREVCGTDDQDYPSACHLKKSSCLLKSNVAVQYRGTCGKL